MTRDEITIRLRAQFPAGLPVCVNGENRLLTGDAYKTRLMEMVAAEMAAQQSLSDAAADQTQRDQAKVLYAALKDGTATSVQTQRVVAWLLRQQNSGLS